MKWFLLRPPLETESADVFETGLSWDRMVTGMLGSSIPLLASFPDSVSPATTGRLSEGYASVMTSLLPQKEVDNPTSSHMLSTLAAMVQDVGVAATSIFQGVGKHGKTVKVS